MFKGVCSRCRRAMKSSRCREWGFPVECLEWFHQFPGCRSRGNVTMPEDKGLRWFKTHCSRMDHGGCALLVGVRDNRIVRIRGNPEGFLNKGYVCPKGLASADRLTHPSR